MQLVTFDKAVVESRIYANTHHVNKAHCSQTQKQDEQNIRTKGLPNKQIVSRVCKSMGPPDTNLFIINLLTKYLDTDNLNITLSLCVQFNRDMNMCDVLINR